jgi:hypothetical protein
MVTKKKSPNEKAKRGRVKVGKLSLGRETIKDLSPEEKSRIKGGVAKYTDPPRCIVPTAGCDPVYRG